MEESERQYTEGPWEVMLPESYEEIFGPNFAGERERMIVAPDKQGDPWTIAQMFEGQPGEIDDAYLIAAAPEMYEALKLVRQVWYNPVVGKPTQEEINKTYLAVQKALRKIENREDVDGSDS
jgi:hypothetical protein